MATVYECKGLNHTLQIYFLTISFWQKSQFEYACNFFFLRFFVQFVNARVIRGVRQRYRVEITNARGGNRSVDTQPWFVEINHPSR